MWKPTRPNNPGDLVLFFDGICGLCNGAVDFVIRFDSDERFLFSPLQSDYAAKYLSPRQIQALDSLVLVEGGKALEMSDAVIRILRHLGGAWALLSWVMRLFPRPLRNGVYAWVARHRYAWFGQKESCRIPAASERKRFLM